MAVNVAGSCFDVFTALEQPFFLFRYYPHRFAHITPQSQPQIAFKKKTLATAAMLPPFVVVWRHFSVLSWRQDVDQGNS